MRIRLLFLFFVLSAVTLDLLAGKKQLVAPNSAEEIALLEAVRSGEPAERIARLDAFVQKFPQSAAAAEAHYLRIYMEMKQWDQALAHGKKALEADEGDAEVAADLMKVALGKGDLAAAVQWGSTAGTLLSKDMALKPEGMTDETWKTRHDALREERERLEYDTYTTALKETNTARRIKALEQVIDGFGAGKYSKEAPTVLAAAYQLSGNSAKATALAQKAVQADPQSEAMHLLLAESLFAQGRLDPALQHARSVVRILASHAKPESMSAGEWAAYSRKVRGGAHSVAGRVLMQQEKTDAAIPELVAASQALEDNPQALGPVVYNLAYAYAKKGQWAFAKVMVDRAVQIPGPYQRLSQDLRDRIQRVSAQPVSRK